MGAYFNESFMFNKSSCVGGKIMLRSLHVNIPWFPRVCESYLTRQRALCRYDYGYRPWDGQVLLDYLSGLDLTTWILKIRELLLAVVSEKETVGLRRLWCLMLILENPKDRGAWRAIVYGVAKSRTWLKWLSTHTCWSWGARAVCQEPNSANSPSAWGKHPS